MPPQAKDGRETALMSRTGAPQIRALARAKIPAPYFANYFFNYFFAVPKAVV
jgi:hypothetical protein